MGFRHLLDKHRQTAGGFLETSPHGVLSPLTSLTSKKRAISCSNLNTGRANTEHNTQTVCTHKAINHNHFTDKENQTPCNIYFGDNFTVRLQQWFKFLQFLEDNQTGGIVHCDFVPNRKLGKMTLSTDAVKIRDVPNAGGSSVVSEVLSFELLQKCFKAKLLKTEMEVSYFPEGGSITDYVCEIFGTKVGVSVTRAMKYWGGNYTIDDAYHLLNKKLKGVNQSSQNTLEDWNKQVLHVWSASHDVTNTLVQAYSSLSEEVRSNTVVFVTTTTEASDFIYTNG